MVPSLWRDTLIKGGNVIAWYRATRIDQNDAIGKGIFVKLSLDLDPNSLDQELKVTYTEFNGVEDVKSKPIFIWKKMEIENLIDLSLLNKNKEEYEIWNVIREATPNMLTDLFLEAGLPGGRLFSSQELILDRFIKAIEYDKANQFEIDFAKGASDGKKSLEAIVGGTGQQLAESIRQGRKIEDFRSLTGPVGDTTNPSSESGFKDVRALQQIFTTTGPIQNWPFVSTTRGENQFSSSAPDRAKSEEQQRVMANARPKPPENPAIGNVWTDTNTGKIRVWTGTTWVEITPITEEQSKALPDWLVPKSELPKIGRKILDGETT